MEEKKTHELTDEALDAVTGGAYCRYNEATGQYDVSKGNGVRCVYDLWYWGEEPLSNTTAWGGYHD